MFRKSLNQFSDRIAMIYKILRSTSLIGYCGRANVNAQTIVQCGEHLLIMHGPVLRHFPQSIRRTNDLPGFHAATSQQAAGHLWPVVSATVFVDSRRAAEFSPGDDADVIL